MGFTTSRARSGATAAGLPSNRGFFDGEARIIVDSSIDHATHLSPPLKVSLNQLGGFRNEAGFWLTGLEAASVGARLAPGGVDLYGAATVEFRGGALGAFAGAAAAPEQE